MNSMRVGVFDRLTKNLHSPTTRLRVMDKALRA